MIGTPVDYQLALDQNFADLDERAGTLLAEGAQLESRLAANRERRAGSSAFVNVPLGRVPAMRQYARGLQRSVAHKLGDCERMRALYQPLDLLHSTLAQVSEDPAVIHDRIAPLARLVQPFTYSIRGPHLTSELAVIVELRTSSSQVWALRRMLLEQFDDTACVRVPSLNHVTIARICEGTRAQLSDLYHEFAAMRRQSVTDDVVAAERVHVTLNRAGSARHDTGSALGVPAPAGPRARAERHGVRRDSAALTVDG